MADKAMAKQEKKKARPAAALRQRRQTAPNENGLLDVPYLVLTLILTALGLVMLFSSSYAIAYQNQDGNSAYYFVRQASLAALGLIIMVAISRLNYFFWYRLALPVLAGAIFLLILVPLIGTGENGAKRWLSLGPLSFQPSELAKVALVLSFSAMICVYYRQMHTVKYGVLPFAAVMVAIAGLLALEPHLSATLIIFAVGAVMMFVGGTSKKWFVVLGIFVVLFAAVYLLTRGYAGNRITAWLHPESDAAGKGYQVIQSRYAIGSGGLLGLGLGKSRQKYLYLPEAQNDYIFAIVCEELGFVGAVAVILLFTLLVVRGYWIALHARDRFGFLLVVGLTTVLGLQVLLNIAVVSNLLPSTGISLPFFSYGGTALVVQLAEAGMVLSVSRWCVNQPVWGKKRQ